VVIPAQAPSIASTEHRSWDDFRSSFDWRQGEHVSIIGPTGLGKTTLALSLLPLRKYVVVLATKPRDDQLTRFRREHRFRIIRRWSEAGLVEQNPRLILWPEVERIKDIRSQRQRMKDALEEIFVSGGWCVYVDELFFVGSPKFLGLENYLRLLWLQGRSLKVSLVGATQRPAWVPLEMYDQASHLFFFRESDETNLKRMGGIGWLNRRDIMGEVAALPTYRFLYICTRTGERYTSQVDAETLPAGWRR
jgi:hypothetical protein